MNRVEINKRYYTEHFKGFVTVVKVDYYVYFFYNNGSAHHQKGDDNSCGYGKLPRNIFVQHFYDDLENHEPSKVPYTSQPFRFEKASEEEIFDNFEEIKNNRVANFEQRKKEWKDSLEDSKKNAELKKQEEKRLKKEQYEKQKAKGHPEGYRTKKEKILAKKFKF